MKKFKLCGFADEAGDSLQEQITALKENDITFLEIRNVDSINVSDFDLNKAKEVKKALNENGLKIFSIGSPIGKIGIDDNFESHFEKFKRTLEIADILGAKAFRLFSFYIDNDKNPYDYKDKVLERLYQFTTVPTDVTLCHENEKGIYGDIADRCVDIHKEIPKLKAVFDPANFVQSNQETITAFEKLNKYIHYMHIKDSLADGTVVPAGKGIGNIEKLLKMYKGEILTLEPHLYMFSGLKNLEKKDDESKIVNYYKNNREAFDEGVKALKSIIYQEDF